MSEQREIKFRAWDIEGKRWLYRPEDWQIRDLNDGQNYVWMQYTGLKDKNGKEIYEGDILIGRNTDDFDYKNRNPAEVSPKKFSRFIVRWDENNEFTHKSMSGWFPLNYYSTNGVNSLGDEWFEVETCEIIGNIYENPELLKNEW